MSELVYIILSAAITGVSVFIGSYAMMKITIKQAKTDVKKQAQEWLNSETGQKALYSLGALIAQGAKDSLPFMSKGGKLKWQDLALQIGLNWAKSKGILPNISPEATDQAQPTIEQKW